MKGGKSDAKADNMPGVKKKAPETKEADNIQARSTSLLTFGIFNCFQFIYMCTRLHGRHNDAYRSYRLLGVKS